MITILKPKSNNIDKKSDVIVTKLNHSKSMAVRVIKFRQGLWVHLK